MSKDRVCGLLLIGGVLGAGLSTLVAHAAHPITALAVIVSIIGCVIGAVLLTD